MKILFCFQITLSDVCLVHIICCQPKIFVVVCTHLADEFTITVYYLDDGPKFDILDWWKVNSSRFPILACLARDVLAIPISTVAFESAFSTSGRILDEFRSSLTPFMVEALVCTQDWLRYGTHVSIVENTEELTKLEQELIAEYKEKVKPQSNAKPPTTAKPT